MLLLSTIFCLFLSLNLTTAQLDPEGTESPALVPCPPCDCSKPVSCEEHDIDNPCNCCAKCYRRVGEVCGADAGECTPDLLCLPDDPYSASYKGKCYEITPCLTFGCSVKGDKCECYYNNVCPLQRLPFYTREECEDTLKIKKCKEVRCPVQEDCGEGMYFEEGPSFFDHCCPVNGHCVCNVSMCSGPPESCPVGTKLAVTRSADQGAGVCCNEYECQLITCSHNGVKYNFGDEWRDDSCTTCTCTETGAECASVNCSEPTDCSITYIPEGECCPVCFESNETANPPANAPLGCITLEGESHINGETWEINPCVSCRCNNNEIKCHEKVCDAVPCNIEEGQEYVFPVGACCPICKDKTPPTGSPTVVLMPTSLMTSSMISTMTSSSTITVTETPSPSNDEDTPMDNIPNIGNNGPSNEPTTPSNTEEATPTTKPGPTQTRNLVLLLNIPYMEVSKMWDQFSSELALKLKERKIELQDISALPDVSSTVNATLFTLKLKENATEAINLETSESDIAVIVNQMAVDYNMMPGNMNNNNNNNVQPVSDESYDTHLTATIIVMTLLAAVTLVSFIGVVIILVIINRRLKTAKTIRGTPTKSTNKGP
ncbi:PREDICTED: cysteine-rich motor neuron 1 protein-like [Amphimedon queenslandica]|uniref:VWFC domain-containing protein n=1 Tax=Amphimedon queenslandica TaxID=400682 RepID=A0A1X7V703_AMPQE|nr:PREDICTED: cysteine-rich motor neuron 1 protein-like [Amphimedon queenslandica]|eukprot:XP_019850563.1 PREDICTED: cysteine-rich motor neuron 1 protein-like [Amphimedon queenslandica]